MTASETDDLRGSAPAMTSKDLLLDIYYDMKVVRPQVQMLVDQRLDARITILENRERDEDAAKGERHRLGTLTNKGIAIVILVSNFIVGAAVVVANLTS